MKIEVSRECILIAVGAYILGLMIDDLIKGLLFLTIFLLIFGVVKDFVDDLFKSNPSDSHKIVLKSLKENERKIVEILLKHGEMTQAELAARTGIPKSTLSRTLQDLEKRGIIIRYENGMSKIVKLSNSFADD